MAKPDVSKIYGKIKIVDSFPDFKIKYVESFPGLGQCSDNKLLLTMVYLIVSFATLLVPLFKTLIHSNTCLLITLKYSFLLTLFYGVLSFFRFIRLFLKIITSGVGSQGVSVWGENCKF